MTVEWIQSVFAILVVGVYLYLIHLLYRASPRWRAPAAGILLWILLSSLLAGFGFFEDFAAFPPRFPPAVIFVMSCVLYLTLLSSHKDDLTRIPQRYLLRLQTFRIFVEIVLAALASHRLLPVELSYHGRNYDVAVGLLALFLARRVTTTGEMKNRGLILGFNVVGLVLLTNVVVHGMLSTPYPWRVFEFDPPNGVMALFPFHLLPLFLVPVAYFLHIVSIRRVLRVRTEADALERPGVGMSPLEMAVSRFIIMPRVWKGREVGEGLRWFEEETQKIEALGKSERAQKTYHERVLVAPITGLEDSSRNWSIAETLEHVEIVTAGIADIGIRLSQGRKIDVKVRTAEVKPRGNPGDLGRFLETMDSVSIRVKSELGKELDAGTHTHPWFGEMTARQWILLLGIHQGIHRRQVERILLGSPYGK